MKIPTQGHVGTTLIELAIAMGVGTLVVLAAWQLVDSALRLGAHGAAEMAAQGAVRVALDRIADQVRQAVAVADTRRDRLVLTVRSESDAGAQSVTLTARSDGALIERSGDSSRNVKLIIDSYDAHVSSLTFAYYDARGEPAWTAEEVRLIGITVTAQSARSRSAPPQSPFTVTTMVRLRTEP